MGTVPVLGPLAERVVKTRSSQSHDGRGRKRIHCSNKVPGPRTHAINRGSCMEYETKTVKRRSPFVVDDKITGRKSTRNRYLPAVFTNAFG